MIEMTTYYRCNYNNNSDDCRTAELHYRLQSKQFARTEQSESRRLCYVCERVKLSDCDYDMSDRQHAYCTIQRRGIGHVVVPLRGHGIFGVLRWCKHFCNGERWHI